jgi:hypothetical protein
MIQIKFDRRAVAFIDVLGFERLVKTRRKAKMIAGSCHTLSPF